jgi:hypothetical protein
MRHMTRLVGRTASLKRMSEIEGLLEELAETLTVIGVTGIIEKEDGILVEDPDSEISEAGVRRMLHILELTSVVWDVWHSRGRYVPEIAVLMYRCQERLLKGLARVLDEMYGDAPATVERFELEQMGRLLLMGMKMAGVAIALLVIQHYQLTDAVEDASATQAPEGDAEAGLRIIAEECQVTELQPGDLFSTRGPDLWNNLDKHQHPGAIGESLFVRTTWPISPDEPTFPIWRLTIVRGLEEATVDLEAHRAAATGGEADEEEEN